MVRKVKYALAQWVYCRLGDDYGGSPSPPGVVCHLEFGGCDDDGLPTEIATTNNDGFELWLGWRSEWHVFYKAKDARRLAWFILWTWWVKGTWCGLKRWLWYRALSYRVEVVVEEAVRDVWSKGN